MKKKLKLHSRPSGKAVFTCLITFLRKKKILPKWVLLKPKVYFLKKGKMQNRRKDKKVYLFKNKGSFAALLYTRVKGVHASDLLWEIE